MLKLTEKVHTTFHRDVQKQDDLVGVEVELEGQSPFPDYAVGWERHRDGSLKSDYSAEYVLSGPMLKDECFSAIDELFRSLKEEGTVVTDTGRAGIHVHLNVGHLTNKQLWTFITCWFVVEELVTDTVSGKGRSGNHFCLRAVDAEALLDSITNYLVTGDSHYISTDDIRYSALNLCSLRKFGSLEFRAMRTTTKVFRIKRWINILSNIKGGSLGFTDPQGVVSGFSFLEEDVFLDRLLGGRYASMMKKDPEYKEKLTRGVRAAQEVAYAIGDWDRKDPDERNPFADMDVRRALGGFKAGKIRLDMPWRQEHNIADVAFEEEEEEDDEV